MRFVCESCRAQYMINDEKVGPKGVKVRCRKCGYVILVKRSEGSASGAFAPPRSSPSSLAAAPSADAEDGSTQMMQTPIDSEPKTEIMSNVIVGGVGESLTLEEDKAPAPAEQKSATAPAGPENFFSSADDDEIGAVFDQVLKTGGPSNDGATREGVDLGGLDDDRQSTRVIDADTARKLAGQAGISGGEGGDGSEEKQEEVPETDWYVAVNDKQTGPLTLEQIKMHWDKGEIGPDSLCWRAGYSDWLPLSEVKALASTLSPKPPKPIVVAAAATVTGSIPGQAVMSVPVQSAFSSGGVMQTVQSEMQVPILANAHEETGTWRPSAASALASLVKDEMDAMAKPAGAMREAVEENDSPRGGLLDLPEERAPAREAPVVERPERPAPAPVNPYMANAGATYSAPAVTQYRPPSSRGLMIGLGVGGILLLATLGLVLFVVFRTPPAPSVVQPPQVVVTAPVVATGPPPNTPAAATVAAGTAPAIVTQTPPAPGTGAPPQVVAAAESAPAPTAPPRKTRDRDTLVGSRGSRDRDSSPEPSERKPERTERAEAPSNDDDFGKAFGGGGKKEEAVTPAPKKQVYVPPAPGSGGDIKEELGTSDVMEVVMADKPALAKCVEEQRAKEPGNSGKLVMKWTVQTNGRTSAISVASEEFRGTYIATCITGRVRSWQFPKHKKQGEPVQFPFKF